MKSSGGVIIKEVIKNWLGFFSKQNPEDSTTSGRLLKWHSLLSEHRGVEVHTDRLMICRQRMLVYIAVKRIHLGCFAVVLLVWKTPLSWRSRLSSYVKLLKISVSKGILSKGILRSQLWSWLRSRGVRMCVRELNVHRTEHSYVFFRSMFKSFTGPRMKIVISMHTLHCKPLWKHRSPRGSPSFSLSLVPELNLM